MTDARRSRGDATRTALMEGALEQVADGRSFEALSLRRLARSVGIVPTAFYRHFEDMEALGLALVDASFRTLRRMMHEARLQPAPDQQIVRNSVETYVRYVRANHLHFHFILRERHGGGPGLRKAIRAEIDRFVRELADDLGRFPVLDTWPDEDRFTIATLIVSAVAEATESILEAESAEGREAAGIVASLERQLRLILLAVPQWRPQAQAAQERDQAVR